ncbi:MAG: DMT family transporter [Rhodobacteraceae bacterium]|nr:DMT family transporter [Paracoccaceae bacterium]
MTLRQAGPVGFLLLLGTGWGLTQTLSKIAVSTGHPPLGLIFWQLVIGVAVLGPLVAMRGGRIPLTRATAAFFVLVALLGTIIPNTVSYAAYVHLPAGIMSIVISAVPILAFPIALALGTDRFDWTRVLGLACGLAGVALIALPQEGLPAGVATGWLILALVSPFCYALEANYVARWGTAGLDPIAAMFGASLAGAVLALPLALATGQFIDPRPAWGAPEAALVLSSVIHALMYAGYVWLVGRAGPVFAGQTSYVVTGAGVVWAMAILGERYSGWVWAALAVMLAGIFLVRPRRPARPGIAPPAPCDAPAIGEGCA